MKTFDARGACGAAEQPRVRGRHLLTRVHGAALADQSQAEARVLAKREESFALMRSLDEQAGAPGFAIENPQLLAAARALAKAPEAALAAYLRCMTKEG